MTEKKKEEKVVEFKTPETNSTREVKVDKSFVDRFQKITKDRTNSLLSIGELEMTYETTKAKLLYDVQAQLKASTDIAKEIKEKYKVADEYIVSRIDNKKNTIIFIKKS